MEWVCGIVIVFFLLASVYYLFFTDDKHVESPRRTDTEVLSSLPTIYYGLAIFCGVVLLIVTLINAKELSGEEVGYMIGWIFGSVLSMFAVGRVIELLQQIRDAVRS